MARRRSSSGNIVGPEHRAFATGVSGMLKSVIKGKKQGGKK